MIKILVVEDERAISDLIRMNLEDAGYACTCVYDGMAAADQIETQTFDLVLLDIMLPKVNGIAVDEKLICHGDYTIQWMLLRKKKNCWGWHCLCPMRRRYFMP